MKNQSYEQRVKKNKRDDFEKQFFKLMNKAEALRKCKKSQRY